MKKLLLSLITISSLSIANAQTKEKGTFELTPKIGYSTFSEFNETGSTKSNSGVSFGATADYYFSDRWSLRSGLMFDKMGGKYDMPVLGSTAKVLIEDKLNYVSIPINANWHFGSTRKWNLNFGLSPSFLMSAKVDDITFPDDIIEPFQLALTFGIGYKLEITPKFGILFDCQYFVGLTDIDATNFSNTTNSGNVLSIGGVFQL